MVNHFASLLFNKTPSEISKTQEGFLLGALEEESIAIVDELDEAILLSSFYSETQIAKLNYFLVNRKYSQINLPIQLAQFRELLFSSTATDYYNHFLLASYLKLIDSTDFSNEVFNYDKRISYRLGEVTNFFRFQKISNISTNTDKYSLLISGKLNFSEKLSGGSEKILVYQTGNSADIKIYSNTQRKYYGAQSNELTDSQNASIPLVLEPSNRESQIIPIGSTGLSVSITGPFNDPVHGFTNSSDKFWEFSAESAWKFDFKELLNNLDAQYRLVENMLAYDKENSNLMYENLWRLHGNSVYKFAGLLLAYVEKVNNVWLKLT